MKNTIKYTTVFFLMLAFNAKSQDYTFISETEHNQNHFGWEISGFDEYACISDPRDSITNYGNGSVSIFKRDGDSWNFHQNLFADSAAAYHLFGYTMLMKHDKLAITSLGDSKRGFMAGSVTIYKLIDGTWNFSQILYPISIEDKAYFGASLAFYDDFLFIGATGSNTLGLVYVYKLENGEYRILQQIEPPYPLPFDFGETMTFSGESLFIGAPSTNKTSIKSGVFGYEFSDGLWQLIHEIPCPDDEIGSMFGHSIAIEGNTMLISAPHATVIGDDNEEYFFSGSVYIYTKQNENWVQEHKLQNPDPSSHDIFGQDLAIKDSIIFISSPRSDHDDKDDGIVYYFKYNNGLWSSEPPINSTNTLVYFGNTIHVLNNQLLVGYGGEKLHKNYGEVYCYTIDELDNTTSKPDKLFSDFQIYPNPTSEKIFIETGQSPINQIMLYSLEGDLIKSKTFWKNCTIDVAKLPEGSFIISIENKNSVYTQKIIVKH